jgi:hypothetical protein
MGLQEAAIAAAKAKAVADAENEKRRHEQPRIERLRKAMATPDGAKRVSQARALAATWFKRMRLNDREVEVIVFDITERRAMRGRDGMVHFPARIHLFWTVEDREFYAIVDVDEDPPEMDVEVAKTGLPANTPIELGDSLMREAQDAFGDWPLKVTREGWKTGYIRGW